VDQFTISFWVRHEKPLEDYFFQQLTTSTRNAGPQEPHWDPQALGHKQLRLSSSAMTRARERGQLCRRLVCHGNPLPSVGGRGPGITCSARPTRLAVWPVLSSTTRRWPRRAGPSSRQLGEFSGSARKQGHSWMRGAIDELVIEPSPTSPIPAYPPPSRQATPLPVAKPVMGRASVNSRARIWPSPRLLDDLHWHRPAWDLRTVERGDGPVDGDVRPFSIDRVYFRVSVCGAECYHTKVMTPALDEVFKAYNRRSLDGCCATFLRGTRGWQP